MRVRHLIGEAKLVETDSRWRTADLPPRYVPIYERPRPIRAGWQWRSTRAKSADGSRDYVMTALCHPARGNWQAMLILAETDGRASLVARFEYHGNHPGTHAHADCGRSVIETGSSSMDGLAWFPRAGRTHQRIASWTEETFWTAARNFLRIVDRKGMPRR